MIVGILLFIVVVAVVSVGTKKDEAVVLYYDKEKNVEVSGVAPSSEDIRIEEPSNVEAGDMAAPTSRVKITMGGSEINSQAETLDSLKEAASSYDPVTVKDEAQSTYSILREGKL